MSRSCQTTAVRNGRRDGSRWNSCAASTRASLPPRRRTVVALSSTRKDNGSSASGSRKSRSEAATDPVCERQVRRWLGSGFTGCGFAQSFANGPLLLSAVDRNVGPNEIDVLFDFAASEHLPAIAIFPAIRTEADLAELLHRLETGDRWELSREVVEGLVTEDVLVGVRWKTRTGLISQPMGFGPFSTMPVTRRAPYVCLATWPGEHENPHRKKFDPRMIDFLDSALPAPLTLDEYKSVWRSSEERTTELLSESQDSSSIYRRVAFRLSAAVVNRF